MHDADHFTFSELGALGVFARENGFLFPRPESVPKTVKYFCLVYLVTNLLVFHFARDPVIDEVVDFELAILRIGLAEHA
jgi:hypothetical protein